MPGIEGKLSLLLVQTIVTSVVIRSTTQERNWQKKRQEEFASWETGKNCCRVDENLEKRKELPHRGEEDG
jgi:hypothetical protein